MKPFRTLGIYAHARTTQSKTLAQLFEQLVLHLRQISPHLELIVYEGAPFEDALPRLPLEALVQRADLVIALGGDGTMLQLARWASLYSTPICGIHKGRLGFLADLSAAHLVDDLRDLLQGRFVAEERFLLEVVLEKESGLPGADCRALNDVVLQSARVGHMITFALSSADQRLYEHYADGHIIATPTGSTGYALSAGGPVVVPGVDALVLCTLHAHSLSARPMVAHADTPLTLTLIEDGGQGAMLSCDGQVHHAIAVQESIVIRKAKETVTFLHPPHYGYIQTLQNKLGWPTDHPHRKARTQQGS